MSSSPAVHIIGAGLAGLRAALFLCQNSSFPVILHEAAPRAGGRCRSFFHAETGCVLNNGTHLLLRSNQAVMDYARDCGGLSRLVALPPRFSFLDLPTRERWTLAPNRGLLPWWLLVPGRRLPGSSPADYLALLRLCMASPEKTVAGVAGSSPLFARLLHPLCEAILNTPADQASARLLGQTVARILGRGSRACQPFLATGEGLGAALVDPACITIEQHGGTFHFNQAVRRVEHNTAQGTFLLRLSHGQSLSLGRHDVLIVASSHKAARSLFPAHIPPLKYQGILNAHYRSPSPQHTPRLTGVTGGLAQWVAAVDDVLSVTLSASEEASALPHDLLLRRLWPEVSLAMQWSPSVPQPAGLVVHERRATLLQTPQSLKLRQALPPLPPRVLLAGDWTSSTLPCTLEAAVQSGLAAARQALSLLQQS